MKKYFSSVVFWCWVWYVMAHVADMITSLQFWGGEELNPYFRDAAHHFVAPHAVVGKLGFTFILASMSYLAYRLVLPLDKRLATIAACAGPLFFGWDFWSVANNNLFVLLHWVNP